MAYDILNLMLSHETRKFDGIGTDTDTKATKLWEGDVDGFPAHMLYVISWPSIWKYMLVHLSNRDPSTLKQVLMHQSSRW